MKRFVPELSNCGRFPLLIRVSPSVLLARKEAHSEDDAQLRFALNVLEHQALVLLMREHAEEKLHCFERQREGGAL